MAGGGKRQSGCSTTKKSKSPKGFAAGSCGRAPVSTQVNELTRVDGLASQLSVAFLSRARLWRTAGWILQLVLLERLLGGTVEHSSVNVEA
jgi:hypothetical protein